MALLPTDATTGFLDVPTCNGKPYATPAVLAEGQSHAVFDVANKIWWVFDQSSGEWLGSDMPYPMAACRGHICYPSGPNYALRLKSSVGVFQDTGATTPSAVGDVVRLARNQGTLGTAADAVAPSDAARPSRQSTGFRFGSGKYFELGTSASLQPSTLHVSCTITRTADMSGIYPALFWAKPNANFSGNGWYIQFRGPDNRIEFWTDGSSVANLLATINTLFPLNTPTTFDLTFDPARSPKTIITVGGVVQTLTGGSSTITSTSDVKSFGGGSGYGGADWDGADIEDFIIDSAVA